MDVPRPVPEDADARMNHGVVRIQCGMCGREGKCTFRDDLYFRVMRAVKDGIDGLIVGSPVYYGGPNGSLCA